MALTNTRLLKHDFPLGGDQFVRNPCFKTYTCVLEGTPPIKGYSASVKPPNLGKEERTGQSRKNLLERKIT